jgi:hypothetical protein
LGDRFYVKATASIAAEHLPDLEVEGKGTMVCVNSDRKVSVSAYAREAITKKGMDDSQITGSASSYARKYALNGLFCIDDTKDADTMDNRHKETEKATTRQKATMKDCLQKFVEMNDVKAISFISDNLENKDLTSSEAETIISRAKAKIGE